MATLIDFSQLHTRVNHYKNAFACETLSKAFAYVILEALLNLSAEEMEDAITDGSQDRGLDAVFVDDHDGKNVIHLFQFKYVEEFTKTNRNFPGNEIDKVISIISDILIKKDSIQTEVNPVLWNKIKEIWDAFDRPITPMFQLHFCANMAPLTSNEKARLTAALKPFRYISFFEHTIDTIPTRLLEHTRRRIDRSIKFVDNQYFERVDGNIRGVIATIEAKELVEMIEDPDNPGLVLGDIFDDNVRVYQGSRNRINHSIIESALSEKNARFWYLNNGLTITCDTLDYMPRVRSPNVNLKNIQIVNGGQTSHALFEAYKENPERVSDVLLLARIYETRQQDITSEVAESTNSQTPVKSRDLRANDPIQKKLEESFHDLGYYYERKVRQYETHAPSELRIDALAAGQAYLAYYENLPEVAKKDRARIFGDLYEVIFNDEITAERLLLPFRICAQIEVKKRAVQRRMRNNEPVVAEEWFCVEGTYHVLNIVRIFCELLEISEPREENWMLLIGHAIALIGNTVSSEVEKDHFFSPAKFFKDGKTKGRLHGLAFKYVHEQRLNDPTASGEIAGTTKSTGTVPVNPES